MSDVPALTPARTPLWRTALMGVYHLIFALALIAYAPLLAWRMALNPGYRRGLRERMGWVPRTTGDAPVIWIHGVSVGEVKAAGTLIEELRREFPHAELLVSATTPTGHNLARRLHPDLRVIYYPLDFGRFPRRALDRIRPACVLLMELEMWPNFLQTTARRGIPTAVINGRVSEQSFRGYRMVRHLLPQFNLVGRFCVQDESYRQRLLRLGVDAERISVTGNVKYDSVALKVPTQRSERLRRWLSADGRLVLVGGSTHGDEGLILARAARRAAEEIGEAVRLVVAPRHPERSAAVRDGLEAAGMPSVTWSSQNEDPAPLGDRDIVVVDTIGHLETFYGACDVAFVGGSLVPRGGQNMLEPAALGKAVVFGPHTSNFRADVGMLLRAGAAIQVPDAAGLERELVRLFSDAGLREDLGARAVELIRSNKGATRRTLEALRPMLRRVVGSPDEAPAGMRVGGRPVGGSERRTGGPA